MKKIQIVLLFLFILLIFSYCELFNISGDDVACVSDTDRDLNILNYGDGTMYDMNVCQIGDTDNAIFLAEKSLLSSSSNPITQSKLDDFKDDFENKIYNNITSYFYSPSDIDDNNKVNIVLLDIKDGTTGEVRGFFYDLDLDPTIDVTRTGNKGEYLYIDVVDFTTEEEIKIVKSTMAHELQHLVNLSRQMEENSGTAINPMDTWLDEALAMAAEHIIYGNDNPSVVSRINNFVEDNAGDIANGKRSLITWTDDSNVIYDYALSYLFMQWLTSQHDTSIYKKMIEHSKQDINAVTNVTEKTFTQLIKGWAISNLTDPTYSGRLSTAATPKSATTVSSLKPGAIAYSNQNNCNTYCSLDGAGDNILQIGITETGTETNINNTDAIKTFVCNVNSSSAGSSESVGTWIAAGASIPKFVNLERNYTFIEMKLMKSYNPLIRKKK